MKRVRIGNSPSFKQSHFGRRDCWWLDLLMKRLFTCLERAMPVFLLSLKTMLFTRVKLRLLATLNTSHVYTLRPQRLKPSWQHIPERRS